MTQIGVGFSMTESSNRNLPSQLGRLRSKMTDQEKKEVEQVDYIDNKVFLERVVSYRRSVIQAQNTGDKIPPIPDEIGEMFYTLAKNLSNRPCFIHYSYKEDLIMDAVENCIRCINNYRIDDDAPKNTFSYFTQVVYWAFLRKIKKEKKALLSRFKLGQQIVIDEDPLITQSLTYSMPYMMEYIDNFEKSNSEKSKNKKERKKLKEMEAKQDELEMSEEDIMEMSDELLDLPEDKEQ